MLPPIAIFKLKIHQIAYAAGSSSRTHTGKITELPRLPSWFSGSRVAAGEGKRGGEGREGEKGRGLAFPHFFFTIDCSAVIVAATYTRSLDLALQLVCSSVCRHRDSELFLTIPRI